MKRLVLLALPLAVLGCGKEEVLYQGKGATFYVGLLADKDAGVRQEAIKALGQIGADAVPALTEALQSPTSLVRIGAADSLGRMTGVEAKPALPALKEALKDGDKTVRRHAAFALGVIDPEDTSVIPALVEALKDNDKEVRRHAAVALGRIGPGAKVAVPALGDALKEDEGTFRWIYRDALEHINEEVLPTGN